MSASLAKRFSFPVGFTIPTVIIAIVAALGAFGAPARAADNAASERFDEQLAAGEFAPALQTARELEDAAQRDAQLVKLAAAQAKAGAGRSAFYTLASVSDDRTRNSALQAAREPAPSAPAAACRRTSTA